MNLLFVHGQTAIGGGETDFLLLLDFLSGSGDTSAVLCPPQGALVERLLARGILHHGVRIPEWRKVKEVPRRPFFFHKGRRLVRESPPDLVVANDIWYAPHARRLAAFAGVPWAAHIRGEIKHPGRVRQYGLDGCGAVISVNARNTEALRQGGIPAERIHVVHPGIDLRVPGRGQALRAREELLPGRSPVLGVVSNLTVIKGFDTLEETVRILARRFPGFLCVVIGSTDSDYARRFRSRIAGEDVDERFLFLGFREDPLPFISLFDVMVLPSLSEGFGIVLLEGMSLRKPVVASAVGGIPEIVEDGKTGFLVPPEDPAALAEKISLLFDNDDLRERMGEEGFRRCSERFRKDEKLREIRSIYRRLAAG